MYTFNSRVRYSECDSDSNLTLTGIVNYLQDCSVFQSNDLGVGIDYLTSHHLGWVVNYWQIDVLKRPTLGDSIRIGTSPYKMGGFFGMRNFAIDSAEGGRLVQADSMWTLMNLSEYVPTKVPELFLERYEMFPKFDMEYLGRKIRPSKDAVFEPAGSVTVTPFDLDSNHHLNNSRYIDWALMAMKAADDAFDEHAVKRLRVEYRQQVLLGETLTMSCCRETSSADGEAGTAGGAKTQMGTVYTVEMANKNGDVCCVLQAVL